MCYAAPGPRCSSHVGVELKRAVKTARRDPSPEHLDAVQKSQDDWDSTKKGQSELVQKIADIEEVVESADDTEDMSTYIMELASLRKRLRDGKALRDSQKEAYDGLRNTGGLTDSSTPTPARARSRSRASQMAVSEREEVQARQRRSQQRAQRLETERLRTEQERRERLAAAAGPDVYVFDERFARSDLHWNGLDVEYTRDCQGNDYEGDYCRDAEITVYSISMDGKALLAGLFSCSQSEISDDLMRWADNNGFNDTSNYDVSTEWDYYGEELRGVIMDSHLIDKARDKAQELESERRRRFVQENQDLLEFA